MTCSSLSPKGSNAARKASKECPGAKWSNERSFGSLGRRSGAWVKFKITKSQEFVIGGYTLPEGSRSHFGSLLVGYHSPDGLMFAGRVGTGFSEKLLASIDAQLQKFRRPTCPFINLPEKSRGRCGLGITPAMMQRCQWVRPVLIAQVKFTEWTQDDQLRQPVFRGCETIRRQRMSFANKLLHTFHFTQFARPELAFLQDRVRPGLQRDDPENFPSWRPRDHLAI
jgi:hypothetical protein